MYVFRRLLTIILAVLLLIAPTATASAQSQDAVDAIRSGPLLSLWDTGDEVVAWQDAMNDWLQVHATESGRLATDGIYGPDTRDATIAFQRDAGITVDGIVGPETRGAMVESLTTTGGDGTDEDALDAIRSGPLLFLWDTGDEVVAWQDAMNDWLQVHATESGRLATDGIYGPDTRDATIAFQRDAGITVDGIVGPETRGAVVESLTGAQPFPANTARDRGQAGGEPLTLTDVRVGAHDGYDRVTFEFAGDGRPGWVVEYTDDPRFQGSGEPVDIAGDAVLGSSIRPVAPPTDADAYDGPERIDAARLEVIDEVVLGTVFESDLGAFIGVSEQVPFRARRFNDPPRVVIDVVHPDRVD